jgi:hypothetical protein
MNRLIFVIVMATTISGCRNNFDGPRAARDKPRPDQPQYTIDEQQRRARDKYALFDDDHRVGPSVGIGGPSPTGR